MSDTVIGVDVGGTGVRAVAVHADGTRPGKAHRVALKTRSRAEVLGRVVAVVTQAAQDSQAAPNDVRAVGVGLPAFLALPQGEIRLAPNLPELNGWEAAGELARALGHPVIVENDANAAAYGEAWQGAGQGLDPMVFLGLGTGVGGGIVLGGEVLHGSRGMAAELGHLTVYPDGARCGCGAQGCLEAYASGTGVVRAFLEDTAGLPDEAFKDLYGHRGRITAKRIAELAAAGDAAAFRVFARAGTALGLAVGQLAHVFNPEGVVLGGRLAAGAWDLLWPTLWEEVSARTPKALREGLSILPAGLGADAGAVGAAGLAWRHVGAA
jgi:glucokinase